MDSFDPHSEATAGYHLFLMPQGPLAKELSASIRQLAGEYGGPVFPPHVTLARIPDADEGELVERTKQLAAILQPMTLTLGAVQSEDAYFRALYASIVEQDTLKALHAQASAVFGIEPNAAYHAHLSLLYGNYPEERKAAAKARIALPECASFMADALHLFKTPGRVESWREIADAPISSPGVR